MKYPKINSIFKRDMSLKDHPIIIDQYSDDLYKALENVPWECTEKIDGTNIRIELIHHGTDGHYTAYIKGRTDAAVIPPKLLAKLEDLFPENKLNNIFWHEDSETHPEITIFGEGYGVGIQKVGKDYLDDSVNFILFDIRIGKYWLLREDLENLSRMLEVDIVPLIGHMTLGRAIYRAERGFKSRVSRNKELMAEGLVLKGPSGILDRHGERIITKLKTRDFRNAIGK